MGDARRAREAGDRHPIGLACGAALAAVSVIAPCCCSRRGTRRSTTTARTTDGRSASGSPQQSAHFPGYEAWSPRFVDYLTFAFTTSAGLGPSEAMPLAVPAKLLVCLRQVGLSLVILLVLAARAIGLIT